MKINKQIIIKKIFLQILLTCCLLLSADSLPGAPAIPQSRYGGNLDPRPVAMPPYRAAPAGEMRGVWVATIFNIDYTRPENVAKFKQFFSGMCRNLASCGFNAIFFQVRPSNDAFYPSRLNPWSRYLSGTEGKPLPGEANFDPLRFMIAEAHKHKLQFHAWLNPYRVSGGTKLSKKQYLNTLAPNNFARLNPALVMEVPGENGQRKLVLNPGEPEVRKFVTATVMEIVRNYQVDSIHFDDYFYPDNAPAASDASTYKKYNPRRLALDDWRRHNVTMLVTDVYRQIQEFNRLNRRKVRFGISPFGIWRNRKNTPSGSLTAGRESYSSQYADTRLWVKNHLLDYIVPQLYWTFNHDVAAYAALADWWCETVRDSGVDLYIGHAAYQLGKKGWSGNELYYQLLYNRNRAQIKGSIIFSYNSLNTPENATMRVGGREMLKKFWQ